MKVLKQKTHLKASSSYRVVVDSDVGRPGEEV